MKPHCMFFDEAYSEHYYRLDSVMEYADNRADCLIVIGTALQTYLASKIVQDFLRSNKTVIEVNTDSAICLGESYFVQGPAEKVLAEMLTNFIQGLD